MSVHIPLDILPVESGIVRLSFAACRESGDIERRMQEECGSLLWVSGWSCLALVEMNPLFAANSFLEHNREQQCQN